MKYRIIGTLFILTILVVLATVTQEPDSTGHTPQPVASDYDNGLQPLKIN